MYVHVDCLWFLAVQYSFHIAVFMQHMWYMITACMIDYETLIYYDC